MTDAAAWALSRLTGIDWNAMDRAYLVGRAISAALSALTILPIAALGTSLAGRPVGLLAALFAALAPMSIQLAHFFTTDSWLTFFVALCLLACVTAARDGRAIQICRGRRRLRPRHGDQGQRLRLGASHRHRARHRRRTPLQSPGRGVGVAIGHSPTPWRRASPRSPRFSPSSPMPCFARTSTCNHCGPRPTSSRASSMSPSPASMPAPCPSPTSSSSFCAGDTARPPDVLAIVGIALLVRLAIRTRSTTAIILGSWLAVYGGVLLLADVKFLRYLEPLAPVFAVGAALALYRLSGVARLAWPRVPRVVVPLIALTLAFAWTGAFLSIYAHENPRLAASRWIFATIPPGSMLTAEYWDDALPRTLGYALSPVSFGFGTITLDLYRDLPPAEARDAIYAGISRADYIIQSSQRVESAMRAAPWRYPVQGRYFSQLAEGALGFQDVARVPALARHRQRRHRRPRS